MKFGLLTTVVGPKIEKNDDVSSTKIEAATIHAPPPLTTAKKCASLRGVSRRRKGPDSAGGQRRLPHLSPTQEDDARQWEQMQYRGRTRQVASLRVFGRE